ncbi:MAG: DUF2997 domain-containing protein [Planctomycetia bacterium]|nr:DUF2997 domain-containing protein [Planctomycetia bacterium]
MKTIEITVTPTGETRVKTLGFVGRTCKLASAFLEKALGSVTEDRDCTQTQEQQCQAKHQS